MSHATASLELRGTRKTRPGPIPLVCQRLTVRPAHRQIQPRLDPANRRPVDPYFHQMQSASRPSRRAILTSSSLDRLIGPEKSLDLVLGRADASDTLPIRSARLVGGPVRRSIRSTCRVFRFDKSTHLVVPATSTCDTRPPGLSEGFRAIQQTLRVLKPALPGCQKQLWVCKSDL